MDRSKVTCSIQVCWRKLGPHQEGILWPSHYVHWTPCWLGSYFSFSFLMLLLYTSRFLLARAESLVPSSAPLLSSFEERLGCFLKALLSLLTIILLQVLLLSPQLFWADIACTGDNLRAAYLGATNCVSGLPPLRQLFYGASLLSGEEHLRGLWDSARCMLSSFVSRGFIKFWVGQVALRSPTNRHALDLVVSLDDQDH